MIKLRKINNPNQRGFSLLEMAMVLLIVGILLGGLMVSLGQSATNARRTTATNQLKMVQEALYGYAQTNGRLPCPATAASLGYESAISVPLGNCTSYHGFVPNVTLGLVGSVNASGQLLDPWLNPLRYSVASLGVGANRAFTSSPGLKLIFASPNTLDAAAGPSSTTMLSVCSKADCSAGSVIATTTPAIVFSMGPNWSSFSSTDETQNASANNNFVSTGYSEENFDDILLWLSPHIIYTRLIQAGQLP